MVPYAAGMTSKHIDTAADLVRFGASAKIELRQLWSIYEAERRRGRDPVPGA